MNAFCKSARPAPRGLLALFPSADDITAHELVSAADVPPPYRSLLVHGRHMTPTLEAHHGDRLDVRILRQRHDHDGYARKILLELRGSGRVAEYSIVRVNFGPCGPLVREEILAGKKPLGRILTEHGVPRRIEPMAFLRVAPGPALCRWFGLDVARPVYGRVARIDCNGQPAVEVLEVVPPEADSRAWC